MDSVDDRQELTFVAKNPLLTRIWEPGVQRGVLAWAHHLAQVLTQSIRLYVIVIRAMMSLDSVRAFQIEGQCKIRQ